MTVKEVWLALAEIWQDDTRVILRGSTLGIWGVHFSSETEYCADGLCDSLSFREFSYCRESIDSVQKIIDKCLEQRPRGEMSPYLFPTTEEGRKQRIQFCLEQAELCETK